MPRHLLLRALLAVVVSFAGLALVAPPASALATQTWLSGVGDDINPCTRTAPCKTWAGTIAKTEAGGIATAIDPGHFQPVTITKSVTLDGGGFAALTVAAGTDGIVVDAPAGSQVTLRGLTLKGLNSGPGVCGGVSGVSVLGAGAVHLENVSISGFQTAVSVPLTNSAAAVGLSLDDVRLSDNCQYGVRVAPDAGKSGQVALDHASITQSGVGVQVGTGGVAWVSNSQVSFNSVGVQTAGTGKLHALCGNSVAANTSDGAFTDFACGAVAVAATYCTVPKLKKKTQAKAAGLLTDAGCALGKVKKQKGPKSKKGKVLGQDIVAGALVKLGTKVGVVVGK